MLDTPTPAHPGALLRQLRYTGGRRISQRALAMLLDTSRAHVARLELQGSPLLTEAQLDLWVPKTVSPYMTWAYWWTRPVEPVSPQNAPCRAVADTRVHPRYTAGISEDHRPDYFAGLRYRVPRPVLAEITDRVHRPCESRTGLCVQP